MALTLEVVTDFDRLTAIERDWAFFASDVEGLTPFQTPEWLITWWRHFGNGELAVMVWRDAAKIAGILPCFRHEWQGRRQITLIGSGISDYLEPAISPEYDEPIRQSLRYWLLNEEGWDVCDWQDLSANTALKDLAAGGQVLVDRVADQPCSEIKTTGNFAEFWAQRPRGLRRNVRRYSDKAQAIAEPEFFVTQSNDTELLEALIHLHFLRWQQRGERGTIASNHSAAFLREICGHFAARKTLIFFGIRFQGKVVAVILSFPFRNTLFAYLSAFDPEYDSLGFGKTLLYESLCYAFENKYESWNFLRGSEPYKADWGVQAIAKSRLRITRRQDD